LDERDLKPENQWYMEQLSGKCINALEKNRIGGFYAAGKEEACSQVLEMIPQGCSVGIGDSVTLYQIGLIQQLHKSNNYEMINPFWQDDGGWKTPFEREGVDKMKAAIRADVFLTGTNAVTLDGKLVNIDGFGNRVAAMVFGPGKVIMVAGANKVVPNVDEALKRIKQIAAPINSKRHHLKHDMHMPPCAISGVCSDCKHEFRICRTTVIIEQGLLRRSGKPRLNLVLVGEELGI
jgi:hypothetical protein